MQVLLKLVLCFSFGQVAVLLLLGNTTAGASTFDPYDVLGISHHASEEEIRKAYKQLVKEWHPDKNKSPKAQDMFIKIQKSYKILTSKESQPLFDQTGQTVNSNSQSYTNTFTPFTFWHKDSTPITHLLNHKKYMNEVVPNSFKKPYLIKVTSEFCFTCLHLESIWKDVVQELEPLGVGIGVVDFTAEIQLVNYIEVLYAPNIVGVINGQVIVFEAFANQASLRQFVESMLPDMLMETITDNNYVEFLDAWRAKNKPSLLLFDKSSSSKLLFKLSAFAHRDLVRFGDVDQSGSELLMENYSIKSMTSSVLLFKENTEEPADVIKSEEINKKTLDDFISKNRFLLVPRLVNQKLLDELCPLKQQHQPHKYCVVLISQEDSVNAAYIDFASTKTKQELKFTQVNQKRQQPFCNTFLKKENLNPPQVIILERQSTKVKAKYRIVSGGWNGSHNDKLQLQKELRLLGNGQALLDHDATLPELNDELTSWFTCFMHLLQKVQKIFPVEWQDVYNYILYMVSTVQTIQFDKDRDLIPLIISVFLLILILYTVYYLLQLLLSFGTCIYKAARPSHDLNSN